MRRARSIISTRSVLFGRAAALVLVLLLVLALAQLLLPRIAAERVSSRVGRYGSVISVDVTAWPAIELLWGHADSVHVRARELELEPAQAAALVWESRDVAREDVHVEHVTVGSLALSDATLLKHGSQLSASAHVAARAVRAALPGGLDVSLLRSGGGEVEVLAAGGLFGIGAAVRAVAQAREGRLVAHPLGPLIEGLQLTLFADRHVRVEGVGASRAGDGYALTMTGGLR